MTERRLLAVLAVVLTAAPSTVMAAGFANTSQSAVSTAMGGVGTANPKEPNASYYNPSLMAEREGFRAYVGPTLIIPRSSYRSFDGSTKTESKPSIFPPPNIHAAYTFDSNLAIGLGATFPYGLGIAWPDDWVGREGIQSTLDITPSLAYRIPGTGLSVAVGGQIAFSSVTLRRRAILRDDTEVQVKLGGDGVGFGGLAALSYRPNETWTFGANYRSGIPIEYTGRVHFEGEEGTPFESQFRDGRVSTELTLPHSVNAGVGYTSGKLHLEVDGSLVTWSTYDEVVIDFKRDKPQEKSRLKNNWHDAWAARFGAEYRVDDRFPVRLGFAYDASPIPDQFVRASLPGNDRLIASLGTGYSFGDFRFDVAYQLVSALERQVRNEVAPDGEYKTTAHLVGINVGYGY
ncbi:MAG: OmpP1/FadL family transporter [Bradymonadaceae bacterium]